mmetsp:Transcript_122878/g.244405  ORF Transcript_122878/g.244405 Transcript_122878/m.244405 type:complete len:400 (+) Transcript_122878:50-1249(+)
MTITELGKADAPVAVAMQATVEQQASSPVRKSHQLNPASPGAAPSAAMRARLGQRGGVVKMSDGFEVFYGLVGDQPAHTSVEARSPVKSTAPSLAARSPIKTMSNPSLGSRKKQPNNNGSVATSLAHRGGFVRKSDGFEVFYGLVGDQPWRSEAGQPEAGTVAAERCNSDLGDLSTDSQGTIRPPAADAAAMFSLATPAQSYAPVLSHTPGFGDLQLEEREEAATITWLGAPMSGGAPQQTADEFCMATPAASFCPVGRFGECETAIPEEHADMEKVASTGDLAQKFEQLGAAAVPLKAAEKNTTAKAKPGSAIADILERMGNWKPIGYEPHVLKAGKAGKLPEESSPESSPKSSNLAAETAVEKPKLTKQHSKSFDNPGLQSRLASLDDAIARLRTLQ